MYARTRQVHFDDAKPMYGSLFPLALGHPIMWPLGHANSMVEARIQIQSKAEPGGGEGHHRRRSGPSGKNSFLHNNHKWNRILRLSTPPMKNLAPKKGSRTGPPAKRQAPKSPGTAQKMTLPGRKILEEDPPPPPALPDGWTAYWDEEYEMYYYWDGVEGHDSTYDMPMSSSPPSPPSHGHDHDEDMHGGSHDDDGYEHDDDGYGDDEHADGLHDKEHVDPIIDIFLFEFADMEWENCEVKDIACIRKSATDEELLGRYKIRDEEQAILMEFELKDDSRDQFFIIISEHNEPMAVAIALHSLGFTGSIQVFIAACIMTLLFGMIMTEVLHRTLAAMIGAALCLIVLAIQNRPPSLSTVVGWMDHGTLGLLWGMMVIVGSSCANFQNFKVVHCCLCLDQAFIRWGAWYNYDRLEPLVQTMRKAQ